MKCSAENNGGFTLVELLVSVSIFVFMTTFLVARYGTFNQSVLVTNTAYDVALTIRSSQSYGLNVRQSTDTTNGLTSAFQHGYGVHFVLGASSFFLFEDLNDGVTDGAGNTPGRGVWNAPGTDPTPDNQISTSTIKNGIIISQICVVEPAAGAPCASNNQATSVDVSFKRPDPDAIIMWKDTSGTNTAGSSGLSQFVQLTILALDGSTRTVVVRGTGQIAIGN